MVAAMSDDEAIDELVRAAEERLSAQLAAAVEDLKRHARHESDRMFAQHEALLWLRDMLDLDWPLPPTRGWAASPDLLLAVVRDIRERPPVAVVEMGSGTSTIAIAAALRRFGGGQLVSLEHEPEHAQRTRAELTRHGLGDRATVLDAPLGDVDLGGTNWRWYVVSKDLLPPRIDMLFVDGPPAATGPLARYPCVPFLADRLSGTVVVYLDDGVRRDEKDIAARWEAEDPSLRGEMLRSEKEAWVLRRQVETG